MAGYPVVGVSESCVHDPQGVHVPNIDGSTTHYDLGDVVPLSKLISRRYSWMVERGYLSEAETDDWGTAAWGEITGTLSNQTDLQLALDAKLNLTGGTLTGSLSGTSLSLSSTLSVTGAITGTSTTDASSSTTGSVILSGGVGIAKKLYTGSAISTKAGIAAEGGSASYAVYYRNTASKNVGNLSTPGAVVLSTPIPRAGAHMAQVRIYGHRYYSSQIDFTVSFYTYAATGPDGLAGQLIAYYLNDLGTDGLPKYIGVKDGYVMFAIGDETTVLPYMKLTVDAFVTASPANFEEGWSWEASPNSITSPYKFGWAYNPILLSGSPQGQIVTNGTQSWAGIKTFTNTTDSSSSTTGGTIISGGLGIAKKLYVGTDLNVAGATTLTGSIALNGSVTFSSSQHLIKNGTPTTLNLFKASQYGYSSGYRAIVLGDTGTDNKVTISIGYDPVTNASGSFTGDGREVLFRNSAQFMTPNSGNTSFIKPLKWDSAGKTTLINAALTDTTDAASTTTGALTVAGGLGVAKAVHIGTTLNVSGITTLASTAATRNLLMGDGYAQFGLVTIGRSGSGYGTIGDGYTTTASANAYNYARNDYAAMIDFASGGFSFQTAPIGTAGNAITYTSRFAIANTGAITTSGTIAQSNTTDASSTTTGALTTAGGMGVAKKLYVGTDANVAGTIEASDVRAISQVMGAF